MTRRKEPKLKAIGTLADLTSDPRNARQHNPRNVGMIEDALREVGAARSIVIDEDGVILAGNATVEAAGNAFNGDVPVRVIEANGNEIIAVRRSGLTQKQKTRLALFDNRTAELAEWDVDVLGELELEDWSGMFSADEMTAIIDAPMNFEPVGIDEQGRLDEKKPVTCPECGHEFTT